MLHSFLIGTIFFRKYLKSNIAIFLFGQVKQKAGEIWSVGLSVDECETLDYLVNWSNGQK